MTPEDILLQLEALADSLSITVRYEKGDFQGGLYRYKSAEEIILNKTLSTEQKIRILATELKERIDLNNRYLIPVVREVIENAGRVEQ